MKKILNNPADYVDEMLEGLISAHPENYTLSSPKVVSRTGGAVSGKVGIVSGGGSGHLPIFAGYVGKGLLDASAIGDVFASPSADEMAAAIKVSHGGAGVLCIYGNYGGDVMNFDMACETVDIEDDIETATVLLTDDVVSASPEEMSKRRGTGGMVYAFKIAGACAEAKSDLSEVTSIAQRTADNCRSIGMALTPCTVPQAGKPTFEIGSDEMEMGMGLHGEPGIWRDKLKSADEITDEMMGRLLEDMPMSSGDSCSILINSLGATPHEELYIMYRKARSRLDANGIKIVMPLVGRYATSMEMTGATITLCKLDDELETYLKSHCRCAFWNVD